jgi:hypothetical protein
MANLDFYAVKSDLQKLLAFLYAETDVVIFELSSEFDREIRRFKSLHELESAFNIGQTPKGQLHFQLWSASVMKEPQPRRIELKVKGHSFRYSIEGAGLMQLYLGGLKENVIGHTHFGHWNEAGAKERCVLPADECNWETLKKISGKIQRFVRGTSVAKLYSRPILPDAFSSIQSGKRRDYVNQLFDSTSKKVVHLEKLVS